ncbi:MAG TPA: hypothetical protein PLC32_04580 [Candidatus Omnitrophota bacterium]|nr:hypothetical protein [Candidatus Omnitrophota bacterium]
MHLGIGNSAPPFTLSLGDVASARDGGIFAAGITGDGGGFSSDTWPATLANGAYLIWHPESAAFRVGTANNNRWNSGNVGGYSVAIGSDTMASGGWSLALGTSTTASGSRSTAMGYNTTASGDDSISMGRTVQATASSAVVIGLGADSSNPIVNNVANSFMVGFNSNIPTFYVGTSSGVGTTGNVGIGISAPAAKLHVSGEARITGISGDGTGKAVCIKADGNLGTCTTAVGATGLCTCN